MKVVDLFCGEMNWSAAFRDRGHDVFTVDFDPVYGPDLVVNMLDVGGPDVPLDFLPWAPDIILASPPCQGFTIARMGTNWARDVEKWQAQRYPHLVRQRPLTEKAALGVALVGKTLEIIEFYEPSFWMMENPVGKLRKHPVVGGVERRSVTYCRYGRELMKPTDLWGGFPPSWVPRRRCTSGHGERVRDGWVLDENGKPCHVAAPRGSQTGTQGRERLESTAVPYELSLDVCLAAETDLRAGVRYERPLLV